MAVGHNISLDGTLGSLAFTSTDMTSYTGLPCLHNSLTIHKCFLDEIKNINIICMYACVFVCMRFSSFYSIFMLCLTFVWTIIRIERGIQCTGMSKRWQCWVLLWCAEAWQITSIHLLYFIYIFGQLSLKWHLCFI